MARGHARERGAAKNHEDLRWHATRYAVGMATKNARHRAPSFLPPEHGSQHEPWLGTIDDGSPTVEDRRERNLGELESTEVWVDPSERHSIVNDHDGPTHEPTPPESRLVSVLRAATSWARGVRASIVRAYPTSPLARAIERAEAALRRTVER